LIKDPKDWLWYLQQTIQNGWSRSILEMRIDSRLHEHQGKAANNFGFTLQRIDSVLATRVLKTHICSIFWGTADTRKQREEELARIDHVQKFLLELGAGFAFVERQVLVELGDQEIGY